MNLKIIFKRFVLIDLAIVILLIISIFFQSEIVTTFNETINPEKYKVCPGDNLSFNLISSDGSISLILPVSPIGDILIPNIDCNLTPINVLWI